MKLCHALARALCGLAFIAAAQAQTLIWTGIGTGWQQQATLTNTGTANVYLGDSVKDTLSPNAGNDFWVNTLNFTDDTWYRFVPNSGPKNFRIDGGITTAATVQGVRFDVDKDLTIVLATNQTWDLGDSGSATIHGLLTSTGNLTLLGINEALVLNNLTGNFSTFSGALTLSSSASAPIGSVPTLAIWGSTSLGSGTINFTNGGQLTTHQGPSINNNFILNAGPLATGQLGPNPMRFRNWDGPTFLTGSVTLAGDTTLQGIAGYKNKLDSSFPNNTGSRPLPGALTRTPTIFQGGISESGGSRKLYVTGFGVTIFAGANSYTGGTFVGFAPNPTTGALANANGSLIFATQAAIPATGTLQVGQSNAAVGAGYMGIATSAVPNVGDFNTFVNKILATSSGAVGVDSLNSGTFDPANSPVIFSDNINLTHFTTTTAGGIRLGTATSAILTGTITPQLTSTYHFGNGGGRLYVQSNLTNLTTATSVQTDNTGIALQLYLQGTNNYTGGTIVNNGFLVFDGANAVPASGTLRAGGAATSVGTSYIGFTDTTLGNTSVSGGSLTSGLFSKFDKANTWGVIGFDSTNIATPTTVNNLDLSGFNNGVYVGTTSAATLTGSLTPTNLTNANNSAFTLRFTAADGGVLNVASNIVDTASAVSVIVGVPSGFQKMSDGTVIFSGNNTYSGGTTINSFGGITVAAGSTNPFGTGTVNLGAQNGVIGLQTTGTGVTIANAINFIEDLSGNGTTPQLALTGSYDFTLSGNITGPAYANAAIAGLGLIELANATPINVTIGGNNSGYNGSFQVSNGTLTFAGNNSAGHGDIAWDSSAAKIAFTSANPVVYGASAQNDGYLQIGNATNLTFNTDNQSYEQSFNGTIELVGGGSTAGSLTFTATNAGSITNDFNLFYLHGTGNYTGGTSVTGTGSLAIGTNNAIGSGALTVNTTGGVLLNNGVVLTNPLVLTTGFLGGYGTFAPTSYNSVVGGPITIGANQTVVTGLPLQSVNPPGTLTFGGNAVFNNGGTLVWSLQDSTRTDGYGLLAISGALDLSSVTPGGFTLKLLSFDATGNLGVSPLTLGSNYSFPLLVASGGVTGFNASSFTLDVSQFESAFIPTSAFNLSLVGGNTIMLNFQAVPEPSTVALLATGLAGAALAWRRRRHA